MEALASVLSLIMQPCYDLTGNWWVAILLFTVIVKIILLPMSLWVQKNSIVMVQIMPDLNRLKAKYFGDQETIGEKQNELFKEHGYHPLLSLIPLAIQILILFGLVDVIHSITDNGAPGTEFLGMVPVEDGGLSWIMPVLAGLSAVLLGFAQNRINPLQREQSKAEKNMTNGISIALSLFLGVFVAAGMAFYWICSNLTAIAIQALCNVLMKPSKYIDYKDLAQSRIALDELNSLSGGKKKWWKRNPLAKREKADYKRFFDTINKHLVFYSEGSGFFKYFRGAVEYILAHSNAYIHYITNDPNDAIFELAKSEPRIIPYYITEKRAITLFMKMDASLVVLTTEDLDNYYLKRSYVSKDTEYIFMFHHMTSTHLPAHKQAYDHYDTLLCVGPHQIAEVRKAEEMYNPTPRTKNLIPCGYELLDRNIERYKALPPIEHEHPVVFIGPSWQEDNLLDTCIDQIIQSLLGKGYRIIVRPHPEYKKRYPQRWEALLDRYKDIPTEELYFEADFSSDETVFTSDILITDWSSIFCEFCFSTLKPAIFIDTPMKVVNPDWQELGIEPTDISLRNQVGTSLSIEAIPQSIAGVIEEMISNESRWTHRIKQIREDFVFNLGNGGAAAGEYILKRLLEKQAEDQNVQEGGSDDE